MSFSFLGPPCPIVAEEVIRRLRRFLGCIQFSYAPVQDAEPDHISNNAYLLHWWSARRNKIGSRVYTQSSNFQVHPMDLS